MSFLTKKNKKGGERRWAKKGAWEKSHAHMWSKIDWKNHSNKRASPWSAVSPFKARVNTSRRFSSAALLLPQRTQSEEPSPGPHHSLPMDPKEAEPRTKAAVIAILHSPRCHESHISISNAALPDTRAPPPADRDGSPWGTSSGRSHTYTSASRRARECWLEVKLLGDV